MKLSFCTIAFRNKKMKLEDLIFIISKLGYDGIEIWGEHIKGYETSLKGISELLKERELQASMLSPYFDFTDDYGKWVHSIEEAEKFITFATDLHCPAIRCFTGNIGSKWATAKQWKDGVSGIKEISNIAKEQNLFIAVETHPNTLADTISSSLKLLNDVESDNVKLILDFYNLWELEQRNPLEVLESLYQYTIDIHAKNAILSRGKMSPFRYVMGKERILDSIRPLKQGDLDYQKIITRLMKKKYDRYFAVECFETKRNPLLVAEEEILYIKQIINQISNSKEKNHCLVSAW